MLRGCCKIQSSKSVRTSCKPQPPPQPRLGKLRYAHTVLLLQCATRSSKIDRMGGKLPEADWIGSGTPKDSGPHEPPPIPSTPVNSVLQHLRGSPVSSEKSNCPLYFKQRAISILLHQQTTSSQDTDDPSSNTLSWMERVIRSTYETEKQEQCQGKEKRKTQHTRIHTKFPRSKGRLHPPQARKPHLLYAYIRPSYLLPNSLIKELDFPHTLDHHLYNNKWLCAAARLLDVSSPYATNAYVATRAPYDIPLS